MVSSLISEEIPDDINNELGRWAIYYSIYVYGESSLLYKKFKKYYINKKQFPSYPLIRRICNCLRKDIDKKRIRHENHFVNWDDINVDNYIYEVKFGRNLDFLTVYENLNNKHKELVLKIFKGKKCAEIAAEKNVSYESVYQMTQRCISKLENLYKS